MVRELPVIVGGLLSATSRGISWPMPGFTGGATFNPRASGANVGDTEVFVDGGRVGQLIQRGSLAENGPSLEQVGEFSVVSNGFNAENTAASASGSATSPSKSGTNRFCGSLFDHLRHRPRAQRAHVLPGGEDGTTSSTKAASRWAGAGRAAGLRRPLPRRSSSAASACSFRESGRVGRFDHGPDGSAFKAGVLQRSGQRRTGTPEFPSSIR